MNELLSAEPKSLSILIVEDNPNTAESLARVLYASGHRCRIVNSSWNALQAALGFRPQLVLLDIALPGITGYEVAREMRQHRALKELVLVAVLGYALESERQRLLECGFDHHLIKPINFQTLQSILSEVAAARDQQKCANS